MGHDGQVLLPGGEREGPPAFPERSFFLPLLGVRGDHARCPRNGISAMPWVPHGAPGGSRAPYSLQRIEV